MNTDTGMLYKNKESAEQMNELFSKLTPIPNHLKAAADAELAGQDFVKVKPGGLLANFAAKIRAKKQAKENE